MTKYTDTKYEFTAKTVMLNLIQHPDAGAVDSEPSSE